MHAFRKCISDDEFHFSEVLIAPKWLVVLPEHLTAKCIITSPKMAYLHVWFVLRNSRNDSSGLCVNVRVLATSYYSCTRLHPWTSRNFSSLLMKVFWFNISLHYMRLLLCMPHTHNDNFVLQPFLKKMKACRSLFGVLSDTLVVAVVGEEWKKLTVVFSFPNRLYNGTSCLRVIRRVEFCFL